MIGGALKEKFTKIVGKSNVTNEFTKLEKNSTDATQIKSNPILVIWPTNKYQVLEIIKLTNKEKLPIVPRGGGSGLCGGVTANNSIVLNMTKMDKIIKIDKKDKYVSIQPGILLDNLNKKLKKYNLFFPVQPASHKIASIGGMISTNASGEHALRFGKMIENILEMEVVTGNGDLLTVKKNKLNCFCGTEGLMGIVVEAKLRLLPKIKRESITVYEIKNLSDLINLVKMVTRDKNLIACEFINPKTYKMEGYSKKYFLLLEYKNDSGEIKNMKQMKKFWKIREKCFNFLFKHSWKLIADPQLSIKNLNKFLRWCDENHLPAFGHIGHGIIHVHFKNMKKMEEMYKLIKRLHGHISGEHGIGIIKRKYLPAKRKFELKMLKRLYDKNNILNPGKVI